MKYLYIQLIEFKRFSLNSIYSFEMTITEPLQLILGTNGSGKSSLIDQLTPLPAHHLDFSKAGSKTIIIEHNSSIYKLSSKFNPKQHHSFIQDNVELNDGGTITIQRELVKQHFNITQNIHDLITGKTTFDTMSSSSRKEWFIELCDTNYEYAITVYNKLKDKHRDILGALKLDRKRIATESDKILQTDEQDKINNEVKQLHLALNQLLEKRKPIEHDLDVIEITQQQLDNQLIRYSKTLSLAFDKINTNSINLEDTIENINICDKKLFLISEQLSELFDKHTKNNQTIQILEKTEAKTQQEITKEIDQLELDKNSLVSKLIVIDLDDPQMCDVLFSNIKHTLVEIFSTIPNNKDKKYSQEKLNIARQELAILINSKQNLLDNISSKKFKLKHMAEHKDKPDLSCPSCKHRFSLNYNELDYNKLNSIVLKLQEIDLVKIDLDIVKFESYIQTCTDYSILYRQYVNVTTNNQQLSRYWTYLNNRNLITDDPQNAIQHLNLMDQDIRNNIVLKHISANIEQKKNIVQAMTNLDTNDIGKIISENNEISIKIQELTSSQQLENINKQKLIENKQLLLSINSLTANIQKCILDKKKKNKDQIETIRRQCFNEAIRILQSSLASKENTLSNIQIQRSIIEDISIQIQNNEKNEKALSLLINQLSPTDGLIAKGLLGFMSEFVNRMNHFIKKIWTYPLIIQTCFMDDDAVELDYKFPMMVGSPNNIISDVSKGSSAMQEVINLAFRVTAMSYLKLQDYPLSLDEFSKAFDETHRLQATAVVKSLIEQKSFSQIYCVSHYDGFYGGMTNAEICVLDTSNITLPTNGQFINQHIKIN